MDDCERYQHYTLEQLRDVERHIDRQQHPVRYATVMQQIQSRLDHIDPCNVGALGAAAQPRLTAWLVATKIAAVVLALLGANWVGAGVFAMLHGVKPMPGARYDWAPWFMALTGLWSVAVGLVCIVAALMMFRRKR